MCITQFSINLDNKPGELTSVAGRLAQEGMNIRGMMIAERGRTAELRVVVDDIAKMDNALRKFGVPFKTEKVIGLQLSDEPGALMKAASALAGASINIDYSYTLACRTPKAVVVLKVPDNERAMKILKKEGMAFLVDTDLVKY
jgi:hypothetical protein